MFEMDGGQVLFFFFLMKRTSFVMLDGISKCD